MNAVDLGPQAPDAAVAVFAGACRSNRMRPHQEYNIQRGGMSRRGWAGNRRRQERSDPRAPARWAGRPYSNRSSTAAGLPGTVSTTAVAFLPFQVAVTWCLP